MKVRWAGVAGWFGILAGAVLALPAPARGEEPEPKRVLVELFASHGCDLCPRAEELLGALAGGDPSGPVVALSFHVDYFNDPWKDPFSDPQFSRREAQYSILYDRAHKLGNPQYLYLTPLIMIDGRVPMVGSNDDAPARARDAIARALREKPEVGLTLDLAPPSGTDATRRGLTITASVRGMRVSGKPVLIGVATYEDEVRTDIAAGELKGKTYVGRYIVRKLDVRRVTLARSRPARETFELALPDGAVPERSGVAVYAQDESTGRIWQAASRPWIEAQPSTNAPAR